MSIDQLVQGAQIRDVNTWLMGAGVLAQGAHWTSYGIVKDDYETLKAVVKRAAEECDMVLISGGSSVGAKDATHRWAVGYLSTALPLSRVNPLSLEAFNKNRYLACQGIPFPPTLSFGCLYAH